jgi:hypothetical protein
MKGMMMKKLLLSLVLVLIFALSGLGVAFWFYSYSARILMEESALQSTEAANDDVVHLVANLLNNQTKKLINSYANTSDINWEQFPNTSAFIEFDKTARMLALGTRILKIKVYGKDGATIYSTDIGQLGTDYSEREEVIHALRGRPTSVITQRDFFVSFTENITDATIVSSYHGIPDTNGQILGVMEIYADRTNEFKILEQRLLSYQGLYLLVLVVLFFVSVGPLAFSTFAARPMDDYEV